MGNELLEDTSIPSAMVKVADALKKEFPQTLVLVVRWLSSLVLSQIRADLHRIATAG